MNNVHQLLLAFGRSTVTFACEIIRKTGNEVSGEIIDRIRNSMDISEPLCEVKEVVGNSLANTAMNAMNGNGLPSLADFLLLTVPCSAFDVSFSKLAHKNGNFIDNRNAVIQHLEQMRTGKRAFKAFDDQLDTWIRQAIHTPGKKELYALVNLLDREFTNIFRHSTISGLAGKSAAWALSMQASKAVRSNTL